MSENGKTLLYGLWRDETFAILDRDWAAAAVDELYEWFAVTTEGEAIALARRLEGSGSSVLACPLGDPDEWVEECMGDPSDPFDVRELGVVRDGDWPGMPGQWSYQFIPQSWDIGEDVETIFNGPFLLIPPEDEDELLRLAADTGYHLVRDDSVVNDLGMW